MQLNFIFFTYSSDTEYNPSRDEQDEHEMEQATGFAVVINGHSLVHALHPQLEQLFLEVSSQCKFTKFFNIYEIFFYYAHNCFNIAL